MDPLLPSNCRKCGFKGESMLRITGPHVTQRCGSCNKYVKFYRVDALPQLVTIKYRILALANGLIDDIEQAKRELNFARRTKPEHEKVEYWAVMWYFIKKRREELQGTVL